MDGIAAMRLRAVLAIAIVALASGCLPIPDVRWGLPGMPPEYRIAPERVRTTFERVPGHGAPGTPPELDASYVLRYHVGEEADTVLVLMPGIFGGATSFDSLARQLVAAIRGLEVWAVDRRANALEDREGFRRAIARRDPAEAIGYYLGGHGAPPEFEPLDAASVPFMAHWGLEVHLRDLDVIVSRARSRAEHVVLGGHSLGAAIVSLYASYRHVDGGGAGEELVDGLVLLDGTLGRTGAYGAMDPASESFLWQFLPTSGDVGSGAFEPFLASLLPPGYFTRRAVIAQLGYYRPDAAAPADLASWPMTNRALAGTAFDDHYSVVPFFGASLGEATNAEFDGNLAAFVLAGPRGAWSRSVAGVAPGAERIGWSPGDPATEHTDLHSYLRSWTHPSADYNEWYFPLRLALDVAELDVPLLDQPSFRPTSELTVPTIGFGAERGLVADLDGFSGYVNVRFGAPVTTYVVPDFTHLDIVSARNNPVVPVLARWLSLLRADR